MQSSIIKFKTCLAFGIMLASFGALADSMPQNDLIWLKKMDFAAHKTDYSGIFIFQSGNYVETSRITHLFDGKDEHERLEGLDGERSEVIRRNGQIWCYLGDRKEIVAKHDGSRTFPALLPSQLSLLQENYEIRGAEEERVAGLQAHSVLFQPRDRLRYARKMWAHSESGLLLKAVVLDEHNHIIEQYAFTQLKLGGDIDRKWIMQQKPGERTSDNALAGQEVNKAATASRWVVYDLPAGFKKMAEMTRHLRGSHLPVTHLVYSDGLAGISVFIEKMGERPAMKTGLHSRGVIQIYTKIQDENLLTVIGEVPPRTVMQVAESVRFGGQNQ